MATDPYTGWGRPAGNWSGLSPRGRAVWASRGARYDLTGRQAHRWASARQSTRDRYTRFGARYGLTPLEVYREPALVRAQRRKPAPGDVPVNMVAKPWQYQPEELFGRRRDLRAAARTRWGLLLLGRQRPPAGGAWTFLTPDEAKPEQAPWHELVGRSFDTLATLQAWLASAQMNLDAAAMDALGAVIAYEDDPSFPWHIWFPEASPGGGERH